jgi:hypothetical protein
MGDIRLFASADDLPTRANRSAFRQFGGIKVFAATPGELAASINRVSRSITQVSGVSSGLTPSMLRYLVQQELGGEVPKRVFSALLGYRLHCGEVDEVICEGSHGTPFRVIIHRDRVREFNDRTRKIADDLWQRRILQISEMRDRYFKSKAKGTWTQAMYMAARLVRLGLAEYRDQYSVKRPDFLANAIVYTHASVDPADAGWLGST